MPKKGSRKIGDRWWTEEELHQAGRELRALFEKKEPPPREHEEAGVTACSVETLTANIPGETFDLLRAYIEATNGQFDNTVSAVIRDGVEAAVTLHPNLRERMGVDKPHPMSVASRVARLNAKSIGEAPVDRSD